MILLALLLGAMLQGPSSEDRAVLVARSADTAFLVPLASIRRDGQAGVAMLVAVYPDAGEPWEEVRRDQTVEVDCRTDQWRVLREVRIARDGRATGNADGPSEYEPVPRDYPPAAALRTMVCEGAELSAQSLADWEDRLAEIRASLR